MKGEFKKECYHFGHGDQLDTCPPSEFHTDDMYEYHLNGEEVLSFNLAGLNGQCGAAVMYEFNIHKAGTDWYNDFTTDLNTFMSENWAKMLASATHPNSEGDACEQNQDSLYHLLRDSGWEEGLAARNPNSGNIISIFELTANEHGLSE